MSDRSKQVALILITSLLPLLLVYYAGSRALSINRASALRAIQPAVAGAEIQGISDTAALVSRQISSYLASHPEIDLLDAASVAGDEDLGKIAAQPVGRSGYLMLYDENLTILHHPDSSQSLENLNALQNVSREYWMVLKDSIDQIRGTGYFTEQAAGRQLSRFYSFHQVGDTRLRLILVVDAVELTLPYTAAQSHYVGEDKNSSRVFLAISLAAALAAAAAAVFIGRNSSSGLLHLAEAAREKVQNLPGGKLLKWPTSNSAILEICMNILEKHAVETRLAFEQQLQTSKDETSRLSARLEAFVQLFKSKTPSPGADVRIEHICQFITKNLGYSLARVFLAGEDGNTAVLKAAYSSGGRLTSKEEQYIFSSQAGLVGYVLAQNRFHMAADTQADKIFAPIPGLPETRSELALPIHAGDKRVGILDVHSRRPHAFSDQDIQILTAMANQLGLAVQIEMLQEQNQKYLQELNLMLGESVRASWRKRQGSQPVGYQLNGLDVEPVYSSTFDKRLSQQTEYHNETNGESFYLHIPIKLREQQLGILALTRDAREGEWTNEEKSFLNEVILQVAPALENARLLEEIQGKAERESKVSKISAAAQSTLDMETVIRTAVQEIGKAVPASRVQIRLGTSILPGTSLDSKAGGEQE